MKLKKVLSICKTNGLYYLYDRIDRSGEITQWLGDGYALYPLDGLPILDEESFCAVFDITGKQREKILFRHERLPEHLNVEDVAAGDKLVREYETTFINGGLRLKPLKTNNGVTFIRSLYLSPLEDVIDMVQFYERTTPQGGSYIVAKAGFLTAAVIMPEVTLPEITQISEEVKGAGIAGTFDGTFVGHLEAMSLTLNFRSVTTDAIKLAEPRKHQLDLRAAQQSWDNSTGRYVQQAVKHVLVVSPKKFAPGKLAPASSAEASGEYPVTYYATYIDGKKVLEIDILNFIYYVNGVDYLEDVRKALGK